MIDIEVAGEKGPPADVIQHLAALLIDKDVTVKGCFRRCLSVRAAKFRFHFGERRHVDSGVDGTKSRQQFCVGSAQQAAAQQRDLTCMKDRPRGPGRPGEEVHDFVVGPGIGGQPEVEGMTERSSAELYPADEFEITSGSR